jgi:hypothetical protein
MREIALENAARLKGKDRPVTLYEILDDVPGASAGVVDSP